MNPSENKSPFIAIYRLVEPGWAYIGPRLLASCVHSRQLSRVFGGSGSGGEEFIFPEIFCRGRIDRIGWIGRIVWR